jgi:hypothetical protein
VDRSCRARSGLCRGGQALTDVTLQVLPPHTTVVGVRFQPGAASLLLNLPADELVGLSAQLDELWGVTAIRLGELLAGAARKSRGSRPHKC